MSTLLLIVAYLASFCGFAYLALAMPRHWRDASGQRVNVAPYRKSLRPSGFLLLGIGYLVCVYRDGPSFGSVLWIVLISLAAIAVAFMLAWRPQWLLLAAWRARRHFKKPPDGTGSSPARRPSRCSSSPTTSPSFRPYASHSASWSDNQPYDDSTREV